LRRLHEVVSARVDDLTDVMVEESGGHSRVLSFLQFAVSPRVPSLPIRAADGRLGSACKSVSYFSLFPHDYSASLLGNLFWTLFHSVPLNVWLTSALSAAVSHSRNVVVLS
jgi:hypothetical protein